MVRRISASSDLPATSAPGQRLLLVWNEDGPKYSRAAAPSPACACVPPRSAADLLPELSEPDPPDAGNPAIAYLLTSCTFGAVGLALGLDLFGTVLAALLGYLGGGLMGFAGLALALSRSRRETAKSAKNPAGIE